MAGVGVQSMPPRRLAHRHRIKPRRLHQHIFRRRRNHRLPAAHHPGQPHRLFVVGHHQVFSVQHALHAVQRLQPLALPRPPHHNPALKLVQVEDECRLTHRNPCKVRRIHGVGNLLLLQQPEVGAHLRASIPIPRLAHRHVPQHPRREAPARILRLNPDRKELAARAAFRQFTRKLRQLQSINRRRLPRHPVVVHRVYAIGRNIHLIKRSVPVAERIDAINGNSAQRQVFGKPRVVHRQPRQVASQPFCKNFHVGYLLAS